MTRADDRAKCIKAIDSVLIANGHFSPTTATSAFDALHGIARVVPFEATEEILDSVYDYNMPEGSPNAVDWECMTRVGDLTNPPERADYMQIIGMPPEGKP